MKTWDECLLGEPSKPSMSSEEILDAWIAEYKRPSEWGMGDVIDMDCGARGFWIKGPGSRAQGIVKVVDLARNLVVVEFKDNEVRAYNITPALTVRRMQ